MGKGTVHRFLSTFKSRGFIQQDPHTKEYGVGIRALELASVVKKEPLLSKIMMPTLQRLSTLSKEATNAGVLDHNELVYILHIESEESLRFSIRPGTRWPAHCTAMGKVLLASLDDDVLREMYGNQPRMKFLTDKPPISFARFLEALREVREAGLAYDHEECVLGVSCIAAPVRNSKGEVLAAISISGPTVRISGVRLPEMREMLLSAASQIAQEL